MREKGKKRENMFAIIVVLIRLVDDIFLQGLETFALQNNCLNKLHAKREARVYIIVIIYSVRRELRSENISSRVSFFFSCS